MLFACPTFVIQLQKTLVRKLLKHCFRIPLKLLASVESHCHNREDLSLYQIDFDNTDAEDGVVTVIAIDRITSHGSHGSGSANSLSMLVPSNLLVGWRDKT